VNADRVDDCADSARALYKGQDDQGDQPRLESVSQNGSQGIGVRRDDVLKASLLDKCIVYVRTHRDSEMAEQMVWEVFEAEQPKLVP